MGKPLCIILLVLLAGNISCLAGEADIVEVQVVETNDRLYQFQVSVLHEDTGWDHYANKWEVVDQNGNVLATRILHHPHVDEQPFTRGLSGVDIPKALKTVTLRAHDSVHGYGGKTIAVDLP
ncbi:MAG: hypothetical protein WBW79_03415 [Desulfocapsaceae bacterium]